MVFFFKEISNPIYVYRQFVALCRYKSLLNKSLDRCVNVCDMCAGAFIWKKKCNYHQ